MATGGQGALAQSVKKPQELGTLNSFGAEVKNLKDTYVTPTYTFMAWYFTVQGLQLTISRSGYLALIVLQ